ncbi:MAG TPA: AAA family ATPase [Candidatus Saccharimonadales bacterium]|nr:AAA family ATPase [Candidatus Saccharimonadales bacterium]
MRIRRLQVRDLRRYRELDIDLAPGVTVVRGPNEAGKSTIQRAIELAITRRVTSSAADLDALRPWDAAPDARPWIAIDFEQEEEDGRLATGTLEKSFGGQKGTVSLSYDGQSPVTDPTLADQVMAELSGIPTEPFFRSTASVRHHELSDLARDETALRDRLQASISGADRGTGRAKKKLERALHDLTTKGEKNPGRLKVAEGAVASSAASLEQGELALAQLERDRDSLSGARERRSDAETSLVERRSLLEKARQAERLDAERAVSRQRYDRYREAVDVTTELDELAQTHPSPNPLPVIRQSVARLRDLDGRIRELRALLSGEVQVRFDVEPEATWQPLSRWGAIIGAGGLIATIVVFVLRTLGIVDLGTLPLYLAAAVAGIGLILTLVAFWLRRGSAMQSQLRDVEIDRRLRGRSEMEAELRQAEADTEQQLGALGLEDLPTAEALLASEEAHVARMDQLEAQLDGLVGKEPRETLPTLRDAAALEIEQKTSALDALGPIAKEPRARERLEVEVRDQERALERARDDEANARARVEANPVDAEQVAGEGERLAVWREQLGLLQRRHRVLDTTLRAIERAEVATMKTATRYLEGHMVRDVAAVTGGRYRRVKVDDKTLDISVYAPERGDWVAVSALSQGTLDLVYLTARLGLVRLVTGDRRPPLVFDDPFVTLDDVRATRALELLKRVASDFQIIYLTTSDRYDAAADAVVELPGPSAVDDGVEDPALATPDSAAVEGAA